MIQILNIPRHERVAHMKNGSFVRLYGPGRRWVWTAGALHEFVRVDIRPVIEKIGPVDPLPAEVAEASTFEVDDGQRRVVWLDGALTHILGPGRYRQWSTGARVEHRIFDIYARPLALTQEDRLPTPRAEWTELTADASMALILYRNGRPVSALDPGRYRFWTEGPWRMGSVSLAPAELDIAVQDLVSADQVPVRIKPTCNYRVTDPMVWVEGGAPTGMLYTAVQLALREVVASRAMEALLTERESLGDELLSRARAHLAPLGAELRQAAVKDIILPGEVKEQFSKVTLARKEAEALSIRRREEVAQTRQLANTAKMLAENPVLLRLKELEQISEIAGRVERLTVVGGAELVQKVMLSRLSEEG